MASASLDHMLSLIIFIAALLIFIGMFTTNLQAGVTYQQHSAISTKTSDLLDTMTLNPGLPQTWSQNDTPPTGFGLLDPDLGQYKLNSLSCMRLSGSGESQVYYSATGGYYSNLSAGFGGYLLTPVALTVDYPTASKLLGINGTYGFQLTLTPTVTVSIQKTSTGSPLQFSVTASGTGFVLANANVTYSLIVVNQDSNTYPSYTIVSGQTSTDASGAVPQLTFPGIDGENRAYALIVYSYLYGLKGTGYYVHVPQTTAKSIIPLISSFQNRTITLAHSDSVGAPPQPPTYSELAYNASFAIVTEEYTLRQVILDQPTGEIAYNGGSEPQYGTVQVPDNSGILIVAYKNTASGDCGIVLMPWGLGSLGFPVTFGGNSAGYEWVTTDIRQVTIDGIAYQAKLALWSLTGGS